MIFNCVAKSEYGDILSLAIEEVENILEDDDKLLLIFSDLSDEFKKFLGNLNLEVNNKSKITEIRKYFSLSPVNIQFGANDANIMCADPLLKTIYLNAKYCVIGYNFNYIVVYLLWWILSLLLLLFNTGNDDQLERQRCLFFLIIKILHELSHLLTNVFYFINGLYVENDYTIATPIKIGSVVEGRTLIGNCGFGMEELVFGNNKF